MQYFGSCYVLVIDHNITMDYITAKEAADLWGISQSKVAVLCSDGFIPKAEMKSNIWFIPKDA